MSRIDQAKIDRFRSILNDLNFVLDQTDPELDENRRCWMAYHLLYMIWHESDTGTATAQYHGGPARGIIQIQPNRAYDVVKYILKKGSTDNINEFAKSSNIDEKDIPFFKKVFQDYLDNCIDETNGQRIYKWPRKGDSFHLERCLREYNIWEL
ncbi:MAG: hypothetical protein JW984_16485 [Deltaproteobacteria bacterium]|uniref:Uncharacterized protein n=1 Tax=Candidatus Zymogenus saltonus TaxID=2844893 RepID=A0A9D8KGU7_9DELT|nr:hypothetical protein [Candidatus Zymogenus saltonus]